MYLEDIYRGIRGHRRRRSEPLILWGFKLFIMIVFVTCLSGYLAIIIIDVNQDDQIIISSLNESARSIHAPNMVFKSNYKFKLVCAKFYYGVNSTDTIKKDCTSDLTQPVVKSGPIPSYWGSYLSSPDVVFENLEKLNNHTSLANIVLGIAIDDDIPPNERITYDMVAIDSEYAKLIKERRYDQLTILDSVSPHDYYDYSIIAMNTYAIMPNQYYQFRYSRKIKELIKPNWTNDFGIPPSYESKPYIVSTLLGGTFPNQNSATEILIKATTTIVEIEKEVRTLTYLKGLGLLGGAWGLAVAMYACLFGTDALRPWGIVQSYCCGFSRVSKNKLKKSFPVIPFSNPDTSSENISVAELMTRMDVLELFLQDYVVDVDCLNKIRNKENTARNYTNLGAS